MTEPKESNRNKCERGWVIASLETQAWLMESKSQNSLPNRHDEFSKCLAQRYLEGWFQGYN